MNVAAAAEEDARLMGMKDTFSQKPKKLKNSKTTLTN